MAVALLAAGTTTSARAAASESSDNDTYADRAAQAEASKTHVGVLAGIGFPRPLAVEAIVKFGRVAALGAEYGTLPWVTIDGVSASLWSAAADARVFPFGGAFYLGMRGGWQHLDATASATVPTVGPINEALTYDSLFINPRLGFLFTTRAGFAFGFEAGVQVPLNGTVSSTVPLSLVPSVQSTVNSLAQSALPTIDLLRIGLLM